MQVAQLVMAVLRLIVSHAQLITSFIKDPATLPAHLLNILIQLHGPARPVIIYVILAPDQLLINVQIVSQQLSQAELAFALRDNTQSQKEAVPTVTLPVKSVRGLLRMNVLLALAEWSYVMDNVYVQRAFI